MSGVFITFEGPEGGGKSTQARRLAAALRQEERAVIHTREPGGTSIAEAVRRVLLRPDGRVAPLTELLLYEAARAQHLAEVVRPALAQGAVVVCERYTDATLAYQGYGRGLDRGEISTLNRIATGGLRPHLTFLLDVPAATGLHAARGLKKPLSRGGRAAAGDRLEREPLVFHRRVRRGYLELARREPGRFRVIPWGGSIDQVHRGIVAEVHHRLRRR